MLQMVADFPALPARASDLSKGTISPLRPWLAGIARKSLIVNEDSVEIEGIGAVGRNEICLTFFKVRPPGQVLRCRKQQKIR
jgi:hypothetical protein